MDNNKDFRKFIGNKINIVTKKDSDIEDIIIQSITESLRHQEVHNLGEFGYVKKGAKISNNHSFKDIDFFGNEDINNKIIRNFKINREKTIKDNKRKTIIMAISIPIIIILLILLIIFFTNFNLTNFSFKKDNSGINNSDVNNKLNSFDNRDKNEESDNINSNNNVINKDSTSDFVIYENKKIIKEKIDYSNKEIVTNEDKSLIVKTEAVNNTKLKAGEFNTETVSIDGKVYDKNTYIIKKGDTLWDIAKKFLKDPFLWPNIHKDNPYISNPHKIEPNYKLTIYIIKE